MDIGTAFLVLTAITAYLLWFTFISRSLKGPRVWPLLGSLPGLIENSDRLHDWIYDNLRACGGTYQTCICAIPFLARKQGLVTVTCDPKNLEHILKTRFDNYPKAPFGSRNEFDGKSFPMSFPKEWEMVIPFPCLVMSGK